MQSQEKKKKILYVITKSNWGGAQKYVFELATRVVRYGFEVVVVFGGNGVLSEKLQNAKIKTINLPRLERDINVLGEFVVLFQLIKIFFQEKPAIIHLNSSKIGGLGCLAGRIHNLLIKLKPKGYKLKARIIFTAHGFAFNEDRPKIVKTIFFVLNYITLLLCNETIVINKKELRQVSWLPFVTSKIKLIYIGIEDVPHLKIDKSQKSSIAIGTISELTKNKGLVYAVEAIAKIKNKDINFSIIGDGEEKENLERFIESKSISDKVQLLGQKENAASYLRLFDIFMLTSVKEGLPYTILEAGLAGLPVIASDVGGIGEVIKNGESGLLVEPKNVDEIRNALIRLIDDKHQRERLGANLRKIVKSKFNLRQMLKDTIDLYNS